MAAKEYGLIGYPLGHSFSKSFFTEKFSAEDIDAIYLNFEIDRVEKISDIIKLHPRLQGFNVTIPYKRSIIPLLDEIDADAADIGAVNTVRIHTTIDDRRVMKGYNTDIIGFTDSIRPYIDESIHMRALVLGSGGASKAITAGLRKMNIIPTIVSRTPRPGQLSYTDLSSEVMSSHTVIVNTTPLGMYPKVDDYPDIPYANLSAHHICYDAIYNPCPTLFMKKAVAAGATAIGGLEMLHIQALKAWQIWND